ncbi:hypothetical protein [Noviherbaspirillum pedocola]|uniref:Uncharacterized protein n=1 Tax=Noviherbaspirillum pedocola TaxID=2801341 RepID=A0A934SUV6_9BURK|nr:hypothetical protein [Noviherbaspirillum pedocola]MBK4737010.1 hypothetical protein [Noviherbaspirillum pedocola]
MATSKIPLCLNTLSNSTAVDALFQDANAPLRVTRDESTQMLYIRVRTWRQFASETLNALTHGLLGKSRKQAEAEALQALNKVFSSVEQIRQSREPLLRTLKGRLQLGILGVSPDRAAADVIPPGVSCRHACPASILADAYMVDESASRFAHEHGALLGKYVVTEKDFRECEQLTVNGRRERLSYMSTDPKVVIRYYEAAYLRQLRVCKMQMDKAVANGVSTIVLEPQPDPGLRDRTAGREKRISEENAIGLVRAMRIFEEECRKAGKPIGIVAACRDRLDFEEVSRRVNALPSTLWCY